jgi:hypothetical protein
MVSWSIITTRHISLLSRANNCHLVELISLQSLPIFLIIRTVLVLHVVNMRWKSHVASYKRQSIEQNALRRWGGDYVYHPDVRLLPPQIRRQKRGALASQWIDFLLLVSCHLPSEDDSYSLIHFYACKFRLLRYPEIR